MNQRSIKFRAWDRDGKTMHHNFEINSFSGIVHVIDWDSETSNKKNWELMQYTGLKDKNGVDIYEGDVVKSTRGMLFEVLWMDKGRWNITSSGTVDTSYEIVGNKFENPSLLTSTKD